jgi:hypothetical protein
MLDRGKNVADGVFWDVVRGQLIPWSSGGKTIF